MAEINVTPMVDVMLVLLIIFMVSAPLLTVGVPLDLPQTQAKSLDQDKEPLTVSVNTKGEVFLQNSEIKVDEQAASGDLTVVNLRFPAQFARLRVDRHQVPVGRPEIDHVGVDAEVLAARGAGLDARGIVAAVLPEQIAIDRVQRLNGCAWRNHVHHAAVHERR